MQIFLMEIRIEIHSVYMGACEVVSLRIDTHNVGLVPENVGVPPNLLQYLIRDIFFNHQIILGLGYLDFQQNHGSLVSSHPAVCAAFTVNWGPLLEVGILEMCAKLIGFHAGIDLKYWLGSVKFVTQVSCDLRGDTGGFTMDFWHGHVWHVCVELIPKWDGVLSLLPKLSGNHHTENWGSYPLVI